MPRHLTPSSDDDAREKAHLDVYHKPHPLLADPKKWLSENSQLWSQCFPPPRDNWKIVVGCADYRVTDSCDLRYPGLGIFEGNLTKSTRIIAEKKRALRNCQQIVVQSHSQCAAVLRAIENHNADKSFQDDLARKWGEALAESLRETLGNSYVTHEHLELNKMRSLPETMETIYIDCTDQFHITDDLPPGPTLSLMNPGGIKFRTRVMVLHLLGVALRNHLGPQLEFMIEHMAGGKNGEKPKTFWSNKPLNFVVVRDRNENAISDAVQYLVEDRAQKHRPCTRVIPIDQDGEIYEKLNRPAFNGGCP